MSKYSIFLFFLNPQNSGGESDGDSRPAAGSGRNQKVITTTAPPKTSGRQPGSVGTKFEKAPLALLEPVTSWPPKPYRMLPPRVVLDWLHQTKKSLYSSGPIFFLIFFVVLLYEFFNFEIYIFIVSWFISSRSTI